VTSGFSLWTSGMQEKNKKLTWCSKKIPATEEPLNWASGQPAAIDGCLALTLSNSSVNESFFALSDCSVAQYFVCEVCQILSFASRYINILNLQKPIVDSETDIMQEDCKDTYDITTGIMSSSLFRIPFHCSFSKSS
jgi:hypothetical protein